MKCVDVEDIGVSIAESFEEEYKVYYSQIMQEIWESVYFVTDAIEDIVQREMKNNGHIYIPSEQMFFKDEEEVLEHISDKMFDCLDSIGIGYSETSSEYCGDGTETVDMVLYGTEDEREKAIGELNNIKYVGAYTHDECTGDDSEEFCNEEREDIHIYIDISELIE